MAVILMKKKKKNQRMYECAGSNFAITSAKYSIIIFDFNKNIRRNKIVKSQFGNYILLGVLFFMCFFIFAREAFQFFVSFL